MDFASSCRKRLAPLAERLGLRPEVRSPDEVVLTHDEGIVVQVFGPGGHEPRINATVTRRRGWRRHGPWGIAWLGRHFLCGPAPGRIEGHDVDAAVGAMAACLEDLLPRVMRADDDDRAAVRALFERGSA